MRIRCGYRIAYECSQPVPMLLALSLHPSREADLLSQPQLRTSPEIDVHRYRDDFGNICHRIVAPVGRTELTDEFEVTDSGLADPIVPEAKQFHVHELPDGALVYLLGSRYCETDKLSNIAWSLFGGTPPGWARVQAICDFTNERITFGYEHARPDKTAWDGYNERRGVCRDFAHLAVTLCRCMNIPAATARATWATSACHPPIRRWISPPGSRPIWTAPTAAGGTPSTPATTSSVSDGC
jgi:transglutaminase-like putative cysteine protease